ncbi:hypothetical protein THITH_08880 [Thioalkalivibrio paradoxus ARh 1]|uniref:Uncharacterized protein n=1 Tax=Thioalkalivibrio paradoxus ARh 1 TaxID=713585 RepID=W0DNB3_9GAMM|nr:hypothetical protein THITH_08880 [Thioalkalivibrio paradoxus ARh 1]
MSLRAEADAIFEMKASINTTSDAAQAAERPARIELTVPSMGSDHCASLVSGRSDAQALKQANMGIAIGAGAAVAIEAADGTLVFGERTKVVEAIRLSRLTFRKIVQNRFWAWFYNGAAIPTAAVGLLHPMIGVMAMTASSLSVIGNSMLLKRPRLSTG